jgi:LPXTG-motif cell wall-anchored protein
VPAPPVNPTSSQTIASDAANASNISSVDSGAGGQLNPTAKVVIAVVVPIVGVALIAIALLFFWKKRRRDKEMVAEQRRKEVEDYSFNPNSPAGAMITGGANSSNGEDAPYNMSESAGYRGWGSTNGGRKVPIGASVGSAPAFSPVGMAYTENTYVDSNGYKGIAPSPGAPSTDGGMSNAPLINPSQGNRPGTADSGPTIGGVAGGIVGNGQGPKNADHEGIRRGISNASSNYSAMTVSDNSDGIPPGPYDAQYYAADGGYDEGHNYSGPYQQYPDAAYVPPVIREVSARRNTQIETPASHHYPQQGNSGIAQNF